ncbi:hypothetical protein AMTR_s00004p00239140 [Amborella trichopoda]|uniref:Uncharacterized protein n=1 Tax=Amborella trichopoda TaxID=13333 RepID=W1NEB0_AMBTC|nr:hypothetical protein AMTR_s00004p00239140 [Amborella trichopoda]
MGLASSSKDHEEDPQAALEIGLRKDLKSTKISCLQELVTRLRCEAEHHQNMLDFYRGKTEHAKETLASIKRKVVKITKLICFKE